MAVPYRFEGLAELLERDAYGRITEQLPRQVMAENAEALIAHLSLNCTLDGP
jgi:hypothetical protein